MTDQRQLVVGLFREREQADEALAALRSAGFAGEDVSLLSPSAPSASGALAAAGSGGPAGAVATGGAVAGGLLGGVAGWLVGTGAFVIPGVGPLIAAGAIAAALGGAAIGAGAGAVAGALVGLGLPDEDARRYAREVRGGATLITVRVGGQRDHSAREILRRSGAYDLETEDADVLMSVAAGPMRPMRPRRPKATNELAPRWRRRLLPCRLDHRPPVAPAPLTRLPRRTQHA